MSKNIRTQMNKVVGKSLNAYYQRVKPAIDDIKFKEQYQGRIIDCMVGEVDDNYIETPETDAPIVKLEHSKEGVIKIPQIKGKTILVDAEGNETDTPGEGCRLVSVGEEEDNKLIILSKNKNLVEKNNIIKGAINWGSDYNIFTDEIGNYNRRNIMFKECIRVEPNTTYYVQYQGDKEFHFMKYDEKGNHIIGEYPRYKNQIMTTDAKTHYINIYIAGGDTTVDYDLDGLIKTLKETFMIEKANVKNSFAEGLSHKKEILINEPLRGLPNGVKDQIVKIGGKYFIERKCGEFVLTDSLNYSLGNTNGVPYIQFPFKLGASTDYTTENKIICNRVNTTNVYTSNANIGVCYVKSDNIRFRLTDSDTLDSFTTWLNQGLTVIVYELVNPIYEPLEIEPTLNTYNDVTHISNNSIIPCNMKIKNTGYNAIIKPSTQYTVALDTNKSGTVGMNLGGAKVTTTNNVATITTPATLADDSLRIYGKGIKGSKVRLLEGDKTNWIPSHFEGMKSSFEDKFDATDNTYKMEILSNNENLFDLQRLTPKTNNNTFELIENGFIMTVPSGAMHSRVDYKLQNLNKNKTYRLSYKVEVLEYKEGANINNDYIGYCTGCKYYPLKSNNYTSDIVLSSTLLGFHNSNLDGITKVKFYDIQIKEVGRSTVNNFTPYKSNKIQFSSIEPLRSVDDVKDRFVFKDDKLMIERNCGEILIDGSNCNSITVLNKTVRVVSGQGNDCLTDSYALCDKLTCKITWNEDDEHMYMSYPSNGAIIFINKYKLNTLDIEGVKEYLRNNNNKVTYKLTSPTYEEIPFELQKIILEGYENGTLFLDTNIPPTITTTYAGETPIVKSVKLNKTEVLNNTTDINDNIVPYLMDMDYRVVCLQLEGEVENVSMARLFGGTYEMLQRDILSNRYSKEEYKYRLDAYLSANKITESEYNKLGDMLNE